MTQINQNTVIAENPHTAKWRCAKTATVKNNGSIDSASTKKSCRINGTAKIADKIDEPHLLPIKRMSGISELLNFILLFDMKFLIRQS